MAAVAANKGMALNHLGAVVVGETVYEGRETSTHFCTRLDLGTGLSPRERRILFNSARQCEVHKMLRGDIRFAETLEGTEDLPDQA